MASEQKQQSGKIIHQSKNLIIFNGTDHDNQEITLPVPFINECEANLDINDIEPQSTQFGDDNNKKKYHKQEIEPKEVTINEDLIKRFQKFWNVASFFKSMCEALDINWNHQKNTIEFFIWEMIQNEENFEKKDVMKVSTKQILKLFR